MSTTLTTQGDRIRRARSWLGMSQVGLAQRLSEVLEEPWDDAKVSRIETGRQDVWGRELIALATILGQSMDWLTGHPDAEFNDRVNPRYVKDPLGLLTHSLPLAAA